LCLWRRKRRRRRRRGRRHYLKMKMVKMMIATRM
jgi:hypothetical protein